MLVCRRITASDSTYCVYSLIHSVIGAVVGGVVGGIALIIIVACLVLVIIFCLKSRNSSFKGIFGILINHMCPRPLYHYNQLYLFLYPCIQIRWSKKEIISKERRKVNCVWCLWFILAAVILDVACTGYDLLLHMYSLFPQDVGACICEPLAWDSRQS